MTTLQSFARKPFVRRIALGGAGVLIVSTDCCATGTLTIWF